MARAPETMARAPDKVARAPDKVDSTGSTVIIDAGVER